MDIKNKIAILITTFLRDDLLYKSVNSILENEMPNNFVILIGDQGIASEEKVTWILNMKNKLKEQFHYREFPFNSGLSYGRNRLVELANKKDCNYCLISSDSFVFNQNMNDINSILDIVYTPYADRIGFELDGCVCRWEGDINLIDKDSFEIDFIDIDKKLPFYSCEIVRNFFISTTKSLLDIKWDETLLLGEHEDHSWRYKLKGYKTLWTDLYKATKMKERPKEYAKFRQNNFIGGIKTLKEKYNIKKWISYKNLENAHKNKI